MKAKLIFPFVLFILSCSGAGNADAIAVCECWEQSHKGHPNSRQAVIDSCTHLFETTVRRLEKESPEATEAFFQTYYNCN